MRLDSRKNKEKNCISCTKRWGKSEKCENAAKLLGMEGEAASVYFSVFDELILQQKNDFYFYERNKRPPLIM